MFQDLYQHRILQKAEIRLQAACIIPLFGDRNPEKTKHFSSSCNPRGMNDMNLVEFWQDDEMTCCYKFCKDQVTVKLKMKPAVSAYYFKINGKPKLRD